MSQDLQVPLKLHSIRRCAGAAALVFSASAAAGEFFQFDGGPAGTSVVAVKGLDDLKLTASYSRWSEEGRATSVSATQTLPLALPGGVQLAGGVQAIYHRSAPDAAVPGDNGLGLKLSAEWQPRAGPGQAYVLLERASVFGAWLAVAQFKPDGWPVSLEWVAGGDDRWYVGRSLALRYALSESRWALRWGWRQNDHRVFIGLSYNSF